MSVRRTTQAARLGVPTPGTAGQMIDIDAAGDTLENTTPTGTGIPVRANGPTIASPTVNTGLNLAFGTASVPVILNSSKNLVSAAQTGTGSTFVMSAAPTITGTTTIATVNASGVLTVTRTNANNAMVVISSGTNGANILFGTTGSNSFFGVDNSTGSTYGSSAYATVVRGGADLYLGAGNAFQIIVKSSGNILLGGTTDNGYKAEVTGSFNVTGAATFKGDVGYAATSNAATPYPLAMEMMVNADKTLLISTCLVSTSTAFTAPRTVTIPNLSGLPPRIITVSDTGGAANAINTLSISTTQPINGGGGVNIIASQYGGIVLLWNGTAFTVISTI